MKDKYMTKLTHVELLNHVQADSLPELPVAIYEARLKAAYDRTNGAKLDILVIYGDREHCANMAYLTGLDPRFEEALLLLSNDGRRKLLVGNECMGYLPDAALGLDVELFQEFSLMGQPRDKSRPLRTILQDFGLKPGVTVGCVGWKYFEGTLVAGNSATLEIPSYLADLLRDLCADRSRVTNATALFMHPQTGLRIHNEPEQIAQFEFAAGVSSAGVIALLQHLQPGVREQDLEKYLDSCGLPLSCHRMISFGEKAKRGLASPGSNQAKRGDTYTTALGVAGALTSRAGAIARNASELPPPQADVYPRLAANYFSVTAAWYEALAIGARAQDVFHTVNTVRDPQLFEFAVNPGHYLHLDEWVHSPFTPDSKVILDSGMVLQMDIIPVSKGPFCYANAEDGVFLADATLQAALAARFPDCWMRLLARREWMRQTLGIRLHETVFPLADTTGWFAPYALDLTQAFVKQEAVCPSPSK